VLQGGSKGATAQFLKTHDGVTESQWFCEDGTGIPDFPVPISQPLLAWAGDEYLLTCGGLEAGVVRGQFIRFLFVHVTSHRIAKTHLILTVAQMTDQCHRLSMTSQERRWEVAGTMLRTRGGAFPFLPSANKRYVYAFGGKSNANCYNAIDRYDTVDDRWIDTTQTLVTGYTSYQCGVELNDQFWIMGGETLVYKVALLIFTPAYVAALRHSLNESPPSPSTTSTRTITLTSPIYFTVKNSTNIQIYNHFIKSFSRNVLSLHDFERLDDGKHLGVSIWRSQRSGLHRLSHVLRHRVE